MQYTHWVASLWRNIILLTWKLILETIARNCSDRIHLEIISLVKLIFFLRYNLSSWICFFLINLISQIIHILFMLINLLFKIITFPCILHSLIPFMLLKGFLIYRKRISLSWLLFSINSRRFYLLWLLIISILFSCIIFSEIILIIRHLPNNILPLLIIFYF